MLDPAEVNVPGGSARIALSYVPTDTDVAVHANMLVERFDYGILARRIKPGTDMQGLVSLHVNLEARAKTLDALMQHANGRIDFVVWPRDFNSGIFDMWAVNLFVALLPAVDSASESKINCAVGRFNLRDGKLTQDEISDGHQPHAREGQGQVDFATESWPSGSRRVPSRRSSSAWPRRYEVSGKITAFKIGVAGSDVMETVGRFLTSVFVVPFEMMTQKDLPRDGADVCAKAMREKRG